MYSNQEAFYSVQGEGAHCGAALLYFVVLLAVNYGLV